MLCFAPSGFIGRPMTSRSGVPFRPSPVPVRTLPLISMSKVLIVNTKGAGHGFIGLHLARNLLTAGNHVDLLQVGGSADSGPFAQYSALADKFPSTFSYSFGDSASADPSAGYDAVYDNNAKSLEDIAPAIKVGQAGAEVFYVGSAGEYTYDPNTAPHLVGDSTKGKSTEVEQALRESGVSSANFRPIYIVGEHPSKREYLDIFFDRLTRGRPVLIPGTGSELTSVTDVRDVAGMMAAALGKRLRNETFNATNTRAVTVEGLVQMCADACGKEAEIVCYDPAQVQKKLDGFVAKKAFPYRPRHFFADPGEATEKLGWTPEFSGSAEKLASVIAAAYEDYVGQGMGEREVDFGADDAILECL